jgi:hypothetical protein
MRTVTYWGGSGYHDEPVDPNPVAPAAPPGWVAVPPGQPGYPAYGYPPSPPPWSSYGAPADPRPATATAVAVLAFVLGGFVVLEGFLLLVGASVVQSIEQSLDESTGVPPSLIFNGVLNLAVGGALITGGVLLLNRNPTGRVVLAAANVVAVGQSIYWTVVSDVGAMAVTLLHAALAVVGLALAFTASTSTWLRTAPAGVGPRRP